jgi:hypothetical protein
MKKFNEQQYERLRDQPKLSLFILGKHETIGLEDVTDALPR